MEENIIFQVRTDGTFDMNLPEGGEGALAVCKIFIALQHYTKMCNKEQLSAVAMGYLLEGRHLSDVIVSRRKEAAAEQSE